jgi:hypothetical protein
VRTAAIVALQLGLIFLVACGKRASAPAEAAVTVELTTATGGTVSLGPGQSATITATVYDQNNQGVTWMIAPLNFGTLSAPTSTSQPSNYQTVASVIYTAPTNFSTNTTVTITATSISNPNIATSLAIKVSPLVVTLDIYSALTGNLNPAAAQTVDQGQQVGIIEAQVSNTTIPSQQDVTWALSPASGAGLLTAQPGGVTYSAPSTVSSPLTVTVTAISVVNSGATASLEITVLPSGAGSNVAAVNVNGGPVSTQIYPNGAFTSVTICNPGSTTACQTVDGILVDTGSSGLRILQSEIPLLKLSTFLDGNGSTLENCVSLADGSYLWGPVSLANIYISGEFGSTTPVQVISSSNIAVPDGCSNGGTTNENTPQLLGANGILGVGPEPTDCTLAGVNLCDGSTQSTPPNLYYTCPSTGCATTDSPVIVDASQQVTNPVTKFSNTISFTNDNNGVILQLPSVSGAESAVSGTLIFGIGTETNNQLGNATVFTLDSNDNFTTVFAGQTLTNSFIDSGSNALFFPDSLPTCSVSRQFFCPTSLTNLSAQNLGNTEGQSTVNFSVDNADNLFSTYPGYAAFSTLAGPEGTYQSCSDGNSSCVFDWGLPFFYGRTVYTHIDACLPPPAVCKPLNGAYFSY